MQRMNVEKRIEKLEKSIAPEPKGPPAMIFVSPGETVDQMIAEYEAKHGKTIDVDYDWIIEFVAPKKEQDHDE
jgi:hypothetical protein